MQNLFQTINYEYRKPGNFEENNPEFDIFKNLPVEICSAPEIKFLSKVRIATNSVVFKYFKIFAETCIHQENYKKYSKGYKFFFKFIFPKLNFSKKRFLLITDEWTSNYYHWHIYALTRLVLLKEKGLLENSLVFLPKRYARYKFALPSLEKIGVKKNQIVFLRRKSNIKVNELAYVSAYQQQPLTFQKLRRELTKDIKSDLGFGEKIYISRAGQALRFVENENELVILLEKFGFKKVVIDQFSYDDQVSIGAKAKYIVAPHGAGLTNLLFMSENSAILEMVSPAPDGKPITDYCKLSNMLNIKYFYQECALGPNSQVQDFHHGSLVVDLAKLEKNLQLMLKND